MVHEDISGKITLRAGLLGMAVLLAMIGTVRAQDHRDEHRGERREEHRDEGRAHAEVHRGAVARERFAFHERDVHRFTEVELVSWRAGYWREGCFGGRCGWWWLAGGQWFFYTSPVYPYPLLVSEYAYEDAGGPVVVAPSAPAVVVQPPPAPAAPLAPQPQMWYYCDQPAGYYPYVASCPSGFRAVPAQPPR